MISSPRTYSYNPQPYFEREINFSCSMPSLSDSIKQLYDSGLQEDEALLAQGNLLGFFKVLEKVELRLMREKEVDVDQRNEAQNENLRSSD